MALSKINIETFIQDHTKLFTSKADFSTLRKSLVTPEHIEPVITKIDLLLSAQSKDDKNNDKLRLTLDACESQKNEDLKDALSDDNEARNDALNQKKHTQNLSSYKNKLSSISREYETQLTKYSLALNKIKPLILHRSELDRAITSLETQIKTLRAQQIQVHAHKAIPSHGQQNHGHQSRMTHTHIQQNHGHQVLNHTYFNQDTLTTLSLKRDQITRERDFKTEQIINQKSISRQEEQKLNQLKKQKEQILSDITQMKNKLEIDLPAKKEQREQRKSQREERQFARNNKELDLKQLSSDKVKLLKEDIKTAYEKTDLEKESLLKKAKKISHQAFVTQLKSSLARNERLDLQEAHRNELNQIIPLVEVYLEHKEHAETMQKALSKARETLKSLESKQAQLENELKNTESQKATLLNDCTNLNNSNDRLNETIRSASTSGKRAFIASLGSFFAGFVSIIALEMLVANSLLLMIPGGLALIGVVSLIVAISFSVRMSNSSKTIEANQKILITNNQTIEACNTRIHSITHKELPETKEQVEACKANIQLLEGQLEYQQNNLETLLSQAQQTNTSSNHTHGSNTMFGLFNTQSQNIDTNPSAPPSYLM